MSGGVDSSVSLILLKKQGYEPIGVSLKYAYWNSPKNSSKENLCCSQESFRIAQLVCKKFNAPYHILDCSLEFEEIVIGYFLEVISRNKTPNPCLICNRFLKFEKLIEFADKIGAEFIATGHYAKVSKNKKTGKFELLRPKDKNKDQTYFLAYLKQKHLKRVIFPLANFTKEEVFKIAKKEGFSFFEKRRQSQDLCFVSNKSLKEFLKEKFGIKKGEIRNVNGDFLGYHQGLHFFTLGQRKGLGLSGGPFYVVGFDKKKNILYVSKNKEDLKKKRVILEKVNFISGERPKKRIEVKAKTRYRQPLKKALLDFKKGKAILEFEKPVYNITPGQWAVFYDQNICLGGGICDRIE
jgi:tRNA-specific 2-thiouridylase